MGGSNTQSTTSTGSSNPAVNATVSKLLGPGGGVQGIFDKGPQVFNQSLFNPAGSTTQNAWAGSLGAAGNPDYAAGVGGAIKNQGNIAAGNDYGMNDPGYAALRAKLANDVTTGTNSSFNNSGLFGSDNNQQATARGLGEALGGLDYQNFQNDQQRQQQAIQNLPGLFQAAQAPSATAGAVGTAQDANQQGILTGQADLYNRKNNANLQLLQQLSPLLGGTAPSAGQTTTQTQPAVPWWQGALGIGLGLL